MEPQKAPGFNALDLVLPVPQGWTQVPDPNVPDAFVVIANRRSASLYTPNAQLVVYRLVGDFDPHEAISHGYIESQQLPAWRTTNASLADYNGSASSIIEGTYRQNEMTLNTSRRNVIVASRAGQVPGVARRDDRGRRHRRRSAGHRRHRQRIPGRGSRVQPAAGTGSASCPRTRGTPSPGSRTAAGTGALRTGRCAADPRLVWCPHAHRGSAVRMPGRDPGRCRACGR